MERKSLSFCWKAKSSSYEIAFEDFIFVVGSAANSVGTTLEFIAFGSGTDAKPSRASAFWLFLSRTMVFAAVRTHFPTRVYCNTVTCVTRVTSNRVEVHHLNWQRLAMVRTSNIADLVPSGIFCLQPWFLQRSKHISPRKTPDVLYCFIGMFTSTTGSKLCIYSQVV